MPEYGKSEYWDERYKGNDTTFDWYLTLDPLKEFLFPLLQPQHRILVIGCGNSRLSAQLYEAGYTNITNVDISEVVIQQMKSRYREMDKMTWIRMDATRLEFPSGLFDCVIDKATTDSILCGANSFHNCHLLNRGVSRVMKKGGHYIVVTYGQPDTRIDHFRRKRLGWSVEHRTVDKPVFQSDACPSASYHVYVMTKTEDTVGDDDNADDDDDDEFYDRFQVRHHAPYTITMSRAVFPAHPCIDDASLLPSPRAPAGVA